MLCKQSKQFCQEIKQKYALTNLAQKQHFL